MIRLIGNLGHLLASFFIILGRLHSSISHYSHFFHSIPKEIMKIIVTILSDHFHYSQFVFIIPSLVIWLFVVLPDWPP